MNAITGGKSYDFIKSAIAVIMTAAFVGGCSQSVKDDDLATGLDYDNDSKNIRTLGFRGIRGARFCELFFIKVKGDMNELQRSIIQPC